MSPIKTIKLITFISCLLPAGILVYGVVREELTANPIEYILNFTGLWALRFLLLTLCMTPLTWLTRMQIWVRIRRMLGLFTFFYACLHLLAYVVLDLGLNFSHLWEDIIIRPFITVGFLAWLMMLPLAVTSNKKMMKSMGTYWKKLHRLIYVILLLACLHFIWRVKSDYTEPSIYAAIGLILLFIRIFRTRHVRSRNTQKTGQYSSPD